MKILSGSIHKIPSDLEILFSNNFELLIKWNDLTELARNEWICRVTIVKKEETRINHINRLQEEVLKGKKRPCCRPGCPHHRESAKKRFSKPKK